PHRVAGPAPRRQHVRGDRCRKDEQRQQQERVAEAHCSAAQIALTWTIARAPRAPAPARTETTTRPPRNTRVAVTLPTSAAVGGAAVSKPRACEPETRRSFAAQPSVTRRAPGARRTLRTCLNAGFPGGKARNAVGIRPPAPDVGTHPICGRKLG